MVNLMFGHVVKERLDILFGRTFFALVVVVEVNVTVNQHNAIVVPIPGQRKFSAAPDEGSPRRMWRHWARRSELSHQIFPGFFPAWRL
jgi:hypothetical protein